MRKKVQSSENYGIELVWERLAIYLLEALVTNQDCGLIWQQELSAGSRIREHSLKLELYSRILCYLWCDWLGAAKSRWSWCLSWSSWSSWSSWLKCCRHWNCWCFKMCKMYKMYEMYEMWILNGKWMYLNRDDKVDTAWMQNQLKRGCLFMY